ncbi:MAG: thioredoxin family protein [Bacteroidales bacterium]|jgi:thioredoxin 1|nr:thioredoxin family protein [Bacteroidales bacterium]
MKRQNLSIKAKHVINLFALALIILFFIFLFVFKEKLNNVASKAILTQVDAEIINSASTYVDSLFNYQTNNLDYHLTLLEFGSTGCVSCKRMEKVLIEIKEKYPMAVNIVFLNVTLPENQYLIKYFGIAAIPTQVILDKRGEEFFRHTGFYSTKNLSVQIDTRID